MWRFAGVAVVVGACSSSYAGAVDPTPPTDGGSQPLVDAGVEAGPSDSGATDAGRTNLLINGDFQAGCGGFVASNAKLTALTTPNADGACKVCASPNGPNVYFSIDQALPMQTLRKGLYTVEATIAAATPDAGVVTELVVGDTFDYPDGGYAPVAQTTTGPALDATKQTVTHVFELKADVEARVHAFVQAAPGGCFVVYGMALYGP